ncbi:MAG: RluA family pseudouridine synthase [Ruminococcaceae bacterium]|nr:RluA family pseudouridine synthase [Oscillospiraceae bacterium]
MISETLIVKAESENIGTRADVFISETADMTRSAAGKLLQDGAVVCGGKQIAKNYKIRKDDVLEITLPELRECDAKPEDIPLDVRYEDEDVIVVNKPCGMVVHPAPGHENGTLVSALLYHCKDSLSTVGGVFRQGIVHRIDRDTTGLIAAAKNDNAHLSLSEQLKDHTMHREYLALLVGRLPEETGTVNKPIARHPTDRKKMAVGVKNGKEAVTHWRVLGEAGGFTLAKMKLETGRTHQIRVHMASIGHPVLGDPVYGGDKTLFQKQHKAIFEGQLLHAETLKFIHPRTGELTAVTCPPPENFMRALELLGLDELVK